MTRLVLPLIVSLAAGPVLAGYAFEFPRFGFPPPSPTLPEPEGQPSQRR